MMPIIFKPPTLWSGDTGTHYTSRVYKALTFENFRMFAMCVYTEHNIKALLSQKKATL